MKPVVEKLRKAKAAIDEGDKAGAGPISWADLIYLAGKATTQAGWNAGKVRDQMGNVIVDGDGMQAGWEAGEVRDQKRRGAMW